ncbi:MAG: DNA topoisomerase I, partial [Propionibacteriaceae bacterium]|nr:DNA topoisomerase I [Propionibacteriaceae bacterium]
IKPEDDAPKPTKGRAPKLPTASLLKSMSLDTITIDDALRLLSLPRTLGLDDDGQVIVATNGRYGPFLKKGAADYRSLTSEDQLFTVTLDEAKALFAEPKRRRGAGASTTAAAAGRALGDDPNSGKPVQVRSGRFGPYVTDGETNATLRKGDEPEAITLERAAELLAEKRAKGPAPKRTVKRSKPKS